jgi:hypothetical protein
MSLISQISTLDITKEISIRILDPELYSHSTLKIGNERPDLTIPPLILVHPFFNGSGKDADYELVPRFFGFIARHGNYLSNLEAEIRKFNGLLVVMEEEPKTKNTQQILNSFRNIDRVFVLTDNHNPTPLKVQCPGSVVLMDWDLLAELLKKINTRARMGGGYVENSLFGYENGCLGNAYYYLSKRGLKCRISPDISFTWH